MQDYCRGSSRKTTAPLDRTRGNVPVQEERSIGRKEARRAWVRTFEPLKVTPKAINLMLAELGDALPRELTGRTRYRAWGIV